MAVGINRQPITVDEYYRMADAGAFGDARTELIEGEIRILSPPGSRHSACVSRAISVLTARLGQRAIVRVQDPERLSLVTEPQPDVAVLRPVPDFYAAGHPGPADAWLVIEVADSSLRYDLGTKARLYAEAGIREYWVVDVAGGMVWRHLDPEAGRYRSCEPLRRGDTLNPVLLEGVAIPVTDLIGDV